MRRAARRDNNERDIINALVAAGCLVQSLSQGSGVPDLLVGVPSGRLVLVEVKDGRKIPSARRLTDDEIAWHNKWAQFPVFVVSTVDEALKISRWH